MGRSQYFRKGTASVKTPKGQLCLLYGEHQGEWPLEQKEVSGGELQEMGPGSWGRASWGGLSCQPRWLDLTSWVMRKQIDPMPGSKRKEARKNQRARRSSWEEGHLPQEEGASGREAPAPPARHPLPSLASASLPFSGTPAVLLGRIGPPWPH